MYYVRVRIIAELEIIWMLVTLGPSELSVSMEVSVRRGSTVYYSTQILYRTQPCVSVRHTN